MADSDHELTRALMRWSEQGPSGFDEALHHLYPEIRKAAKHLLKRSDLTLTPETLAQQVSMELAALTQSSWESRRPFFGFVYLKMRQYLDDYRKRKRAAKRNPKAQPPPEVTPAQRGPGTEFAERELHHLLAQIFHGDVQTFKVVVLKLAGFTSDQIAARLGLSPSTVDRRLEVARRRLDVVLRKKRESS